MIYGGLGSLFLVELDENGAHVVHAELVAAVLGDQLVKEFL